MPLIAYSCASKHVNKKLVRSAKDAPASLVCDKCGQEAKKTLSAPSSQSKIVIDNGVQARAVEILPNIIELNEERANKDYSEE